MKKPGMLDRVIWVRQMHLARVRFIPTLELQDDRVVEKLYDAWQEEGKPERINLYHKDGGRIIKIKRRKPKGGGK